MRSPKVSGVCPSSAVSSAPFCSSPALIIAIVAAAAVICLVIGWSYHGVLSKNAQIELQDRQLPD